MFGTNELYAAIGMVVVTDAWVELDLVLFHAVLANPISKDVEIAVTQRSRSVSNRIDECKDLLKQRDDLPPDQRDALREVLLDTAEAHRQRDRVAHDLWIPSGGIRDASNPEAWRRMKLLRPGEQSPLLKVEDVHAVRDALLRCGFRLMAASGALLPTADIDADWSVVRGEFDLAPWPDSRIIRRSRAADRP